MAAKNTALIPLLFSVPILGVTLGSCKSLNTDLGRNVYERELEDTFENNPAGVIATNSGNRLVVFREHSFVGEPPASNDDDSGGRSQGVQFLREATYRLAEARANATEAMIALKNAGMSDKAILATVPSSADWTDMFLQTLELSKETAVAEFDGQQHSEDWEDEWSDEWSDEWDDEWDEEWDEEWGDEWSDDSCETDSACNAKEWAEEPGKDQWQTSDLGPESTGSWFSPDKEDWGKSNFRSSWISGPASGEGPACDSAENCESIEVQECESESEADHTPFEHQHAGAPVFTEEGTFELALVANDVSLLADADPAQRLPAPTELHSRPIALQAPIALPLKAVDRFHGTEQRLDENHMWRVQYFNPSRAGDPVTLTVRCLDTQGGQADPEAMQAEYTLKVDASSGSGVKLIKIPTGWGFVKLSTDDSKPMYAAFF
jgi:hypothetical protein